MNNSTTKRGNKTQQRIVHAAATLIHQKGANGTSVDEILSASNAGKSQFYHYFTSKDELILAVLAHWIHRSLTYAEISLMTSNDPTTCIAALFDGAKESLNSMGCCHGCPVASLALELGGPDGMLRDYVDLFYRDFQSLITSKLVELQSAGQLRSTENLEDLAEFISATFHGSLLLSTVQSNTKPISTAKKAVLAHLRC